jgi:sugar/nucleoside kinase (ribokinase family)
LNRDGSFCIVPSLKLPQGYIKGTVGAGDAFCAGCLYAIYHGYDDRAMLEFASGAAACNLAAEDSVSGMKDKKYIHDLIENYERINL